VALLKSPGGNDANGVLTHASVKTPMKVRRPYLPNGELAVVIRK
jgi:hypothetical protein